MDTNGVMKRYTIKIKNPVMGVPISFLDKYCPTQFRIVGVANHGKDSKYDLFKPTINGILVFKRILIQRIG